MILSSAHAMARQIAYILLAVISVGIAGLRGETGTPLPKFDGFVASKKGTRIEGAKIFITWTDAINDPELDSSIPPIDRILGSAISGPDGYYEIRWNQPHIPGRGERDPAFLLTVLHPKWVPLQRTLWLRESGDIRATIQMKAGVKYEGRVVDELHRPIANAKVRLEAFCSDTGKGSFFLHQTGGSCNFMGLSETLTATTDLNGDYFFPSLPKSKFVLLRVQHPEYPTATRIRNTTDTLLSDDDPKKKNTQLEEWWADYDDDIHMGAQGHLEITVRDKDSKKPIEGVEVAPFRGGISAFADREGKVTLPIKIHPINNVVFVRTPESFDWKMVALEKEGQAFVVQLPGEKSLVRIQGTVWEAGRKKGLPNVTVACQGRVFTRTNQEGRYQFIVPRASQNNGIVTIAGPIEGWQLPFRALMNDPDEIQLSSDPVRHERTVKLLDDISDVDFEVDKQPLTTIVVNGLDGKPSPRAKLAISALARWTTKEFETDSDGMVQVPLLPNFGYAFHAQGHQSGAAITWVDRLTCENPISISLQPSVKVDGSVWFEDIFKQTSPAEGSYVVLQLPKEEGATFGINVRYFAMRMARINSDGDFSFLLPRMDASIAKLTVVNCGTNFDYDRRLSLAEDTELPLNVLNQIFIGDD